MDGGPVRRRRTLQDSLYAPRIERLLQLRIGERLGQGPADAGGARTIQVAAQSGTADGQAG